MLRAIFKQNKISEMLEKNYRTYCSTQEIQVPDNFQIKELLEGVLEESKMADKRARSMDLDDFLNILLAFNTKGIYFA